MNGANTFFVDSNLALYYVDRSDQEKRSRAADWLNHMWLEGAGRVSWQVLNEFYSNAVRKMRVDSAEVREIVEDLSKWRPVDNSLGLMHDAWRLIDGEQLNYWDALIVAAAERSGARYLLSEDFQDGHVFGAVQVLDPFKHSPSEFSW